MAQINMPQRKNPNNEAAKYLPLVGAGIGALAGGVGAAPGAALGASLSGASTGAGLGGIAQGAVASNSPQRSQGIPQPNQASAMAQRQQKLSQDNLATLQQAEAGLPKLPEHLRQQYAPAVIQARMLEERQRGLV